MITTEETRVLDINSEMVGTTTETLMANAGGAIASTFNERFEKCKIAVICGTGNNGGDGFVASASLKEMGWDVTVLLVKTQNDIRSEVARARLNDIKGVMNIIEKASVETIGDYDLLLDAMLGTGMSGELREPYMAWVNAINNSGKRTVSVDVPSGFATDTPIKPVMTIALHDVKEGMNQDNSGEIVIVDIGIPKEAIEFVGLGEFTYYPAPDVNCHKGDNGRLLVIGGGPYTGAPALSAMAAYAAGVDLVNIATPESCFEVIASFSPNFIVHPLPGRILTPDHLGTLSELAEKADTVVIGPGLGNDPGTLRAVREFISSTDKPMIIDADGLTALAGHLEILNGKTAVLTPHKGEFCKLTGNQDISESEIVRLANETGATILLKGKIDIITNGKYIKKNRTGNPGMTVGGTGDVLAGILGGLVAKGVEPYNGARLAAYLSGAAGDLAFEEMSFSMTAPDVIYQVPILLQKCLSI